MEAMSSDTDGRDIGDQALTDRQRWAVLRIGALAVALALTVPLYYALVAVVPAIGAVVPPVVAHAAMAVGLCIVLPAALVYAHVLANRADSTSAENQEYGANDRWERQNL